MVTKKQRDSLTGEYPYIVAKQVNEYLLHLKFKRKYEDFSMYDFDNEGIFKWIIVELDKMIICYPMNVKEYQDYKKYEREFWGVK